MSSRKSPEGNRWWIRVVRSGSGREVLGPMGAEEEGGAGWDRRQVLDPALFRV